MLDPDVRVSILFQVITVERRRCFETVKHFILIKYYVCISLFGSLTFGNLLMVA